MKILSRYILKEHIAPFLFAFFTITFLLILDYIPKIADQVMDKDLSLLVALELLALNLAWMLALSVPMSALVATLMAFGRLTSDFEITAIKASAINMLRILFPLLIAGLVLTFGMIQFNDKILPDLNKRARELRGDISAMRPTLVFKSGIFINDVPGYLILIDHINHSTSRVDGVRITETKDHNQPRIILAEYGYLKTSINNTSMQFDLYNGEIHSLNITDPDNYRRIDFKNQIINIAGVSNELKRSESNYRGDREMGIEEMRKVVNQASDQIPIQQENIITSLDQQLDNLFADSFAFPGSTSLNDSMALAQVKMTVTNFGTQLERNRTQIKAHRATMAKYQIEIYKKYSIPGAIISFILIGAPLGIMTRKRGMGRAISVSIILFIIYWLFLIGGEDLADRGMMSPFWAMWSANFLVGGVGLYLLYIVVTEKPLFSYFRKIK